MRFKMILEYIKNNDNYNTVRQVVTGKFNISYSLLLKLKKNNKIYLNNSNTFSLSHSSTFKSVKSSFIGTLVLIVPNILDNSANSLFSTIFSLCYAYPVLSPSLFL